MAKSGALQWVKSKTRRIRDGAIIAATICILSFVLKPGWENLERASLVRDSWWCLVIISLIVMVGGELLEIFYENRYEELREIEAEQRLSKIEERLTFLEIASTS